MCRVFVELNSPPGASHLFRISPEQPFRDHRAMGELLGLLARHRRLAAVINRDCPVVLAGMAGDGVQYNRGSSGTARHEPEIEEEDED